MKRLDANDPESRSADPVAGNFERLKALFPDLVTEGPDGAAVNVDVLKVLVGDRTVTDCDEKYGLNWHGKRRARQLALTPSTGTLRPCPDDSVDWDATQNLMIEGDNLEVLKLLQKSYAGKVKLVYIDPPYNTGSDFVYRDDFHDNVRNYLLMTRQMDEAGKKLSSNTEASGRFHTDWLSMMYPRLKLARNLLRDDGAIFISIDDHEAANVRRICDEVFGEENFRADIGWQKRYTRSNNTVDFTTVLEHILVYGKSDRFEVNLLPRTDEADARYSNPDKDPRGVWKGASFLNPATPEQRPNLSYPLTNPNTGETTSPTKNAWRRSKEEFARLQEEQRLYWGADGRSAVPSIKMFLSEARGLTPINFWSHEYAGNTDDGTRDLAELIPGRVFDNPKPVLLLKRIIEHGANADAIVLDFFAGSCVTAQAVLEKNTEDGGSRRFIMVQLPEPCGESSAARRSGYENIAEIGKDRIRRVLAAPQLELRGSPGSAGFRVFRLDSSNIRAWEPDRDDLEKALFDSVQHLKTDRSEADVLYELLLKLGLDLCVPIETRNIAGTEVHAIGGGVLMACLAEKISRDDAEAVAQGIVAWHEALAPAGDTTCVFRDSAFADDVAKTNLAAILEQHGIAKVRSL